MASSGPLFNVFSLRGVRIPSAASLELAVENRKLTGGYVRRSEFLDDRQVSHLGFMQAAWLKRVAKKIAKEFPGGFPPDHKIYAYLLKIPPGAAEQEVHADGDETMYARFWSIFIPLTNHRMQGTTAFIVNGRTVLPPRGCSNYLFDSTVFHYGQANHSNQARFVLMLKVAPAESDRHVSF